MVSSAFYFETFNLLTATSDADIIIKQQHCHRIIIR